MSNPSEFGQNESPRRAVFFDRDGTLNEEVGYLDDLHRFLVYPFAGQAVREVNQAGLFAVVLTNQSGVGRGIFPEELVNAAHERLLAAMQRVGARLDAIYYCPHHPAAEIAQYRVECPCRKPAPGMMQQAAQWLGIRLNESFVIGDRYVDVEMAHRVGAASVLVQTGFGQSEWEMFRGQGAAQPDHVAENVYEAVQWILRSLK
ncbi:MAG: HAD family hydrolase [Acidobacteria bacterium]|nr:HAD family hydrolase [Acidobacteriota bacterium]